jgi:hypothetical protein
VREAHAAHLEIPGWLAQGLGTVAAELPGKADELLKHQGSRAEFSLVRRLVHGTIGWPEGASPSASAPVRRGPRLLSGQVRRQQIVAGAQHLIGRRRRSTSMGLQGECVHIG